MASICPTGVLVNSYTGTGSGTLYNAFNNGCVELSTSVPSGGSGTMARLDQSYTLSSGVTVYLDTAGSSMIYRMGEASGVTLTYGMSATGAMAFDAVPVSSSQAYAEVVLDPSFQVVYSGNPVVIDPATIVTVTSLSNFAGGSTIQLSHTYYSNAYLPTLKFGEPVAVPIPIQVIGGGNIDTNGQTGTLLMDVSGSADLNVIGTGTLKLDAMNGVSLTGSVIINPGTTVEVDEGTIKAPGLWQVGGTFSLGSDASSPEISALSGSGSVLLGAKTLTVDNGGTTFLGGIQGTGGLTLAGGTQFLGGTNSYSGLTTIDTGATLSLSGGGSIAASSSVSDSGTLDISNTSGGATIQSLSGGGAVQLGSKTLTLSQPTQTFSGNIQGPGNLHIASGNETLNGSNSYTGLTTIDGGATLTLSGGGSLASSSTMLDNGTLSFNNSTSSLGVAISGSGGVVVAAGSATLTRASSYTGSTTIGAGTTLRLAGAGSIANSSVNDSGLLDISGATAGSSIDSLAGNGNVSLTIAPVSPFNGGGNLPPNVSGAGAALDSVVASATGALFDRLSTLFAQPSLSTALQTIDGELYAATPSWLLLDDQQEWGQLFERLSLNERADGTPADHGFAWVDGSRTRVIGDGNALGLGQSSSGLTLGREIHRGAWALGLAAGTLQAGVTRDGIGDGATTQMYRVGVFASRPLGALQLGTLLGYSQGQVRYGMAGREARMLSWQSRLGRDFRLSPRDLLNPVLGLDLQALRLRGAAESDPLLGLQVPAQRACTASLLAALRAVHAWDWRGASGEFSATLGLRHWLRRPPGAVLLRYNGIPDMPFTTSTEAPPRNLLEAGIGLHAQLRRRLSAELSLRGDYGRSVRAGKIEARLEWGF
ncbi:autotransporter domain-containing protein [Thiomonas sp. FB-6]|uniref:autotransporter outer membrane beta-barrel domain-containing protein n=1 Tax=Thiomonas sp. FB-6 TaxID=1158291 RepID=UPI0003723AB6|nr:autotransporter outer membrane beta-barrel domain-containing protein [Thiomonas sp. FB-6]